MRHAVLMASCMRNTKKERQKREKEREKEKEKEKERDREEEREDERCNQGQEKRENREREKRRKCNLFIIFKSRKKDGVYFWKTRKWVLTKKGRERLCVEQQQASISTSSESCTKRQRQREGGREEVGETEGEISRE